MVQLREDPGAEEAAEAARCCSCALIVERRYFEYWIGMMSSDIPCTAREHRKLTLQTKAE